MMKQARDEYAVYSDLAFEVLSSRQWWLVVEATICQTGVVNPNFKIQNQEKIASNLN